MKIIISILTAIVLPIILYVLILVVLLGASRPIKIYKYDVNKPSLINKIRTFKQMNIKLYYDYDENYDIDRGMSYDVDMDYRNETIQINHIDYFYVIHEMKEIYLLGWRDNKSHKEFDNNTKDILNHSKEIKAFEENVVSKIGKYQEKSNFFYHL